MAKPTGAVEYNQAGLDVQNATESSPARAYINLIIPKQATAFSGDYRVKRQKIRLTPIVDVTTGSGLYIEAYAGDSIIGRWENIGSSGTQSARTDDREPDTNLSSIYFSTDVDVEFVRIEIRAWAASSVTSLKVIGFWARTVNSGITGLGFHNCNTGTAANRLYKPNRSLSAYHTRRLMAGSLNALALSSEIEQMVPLYGEVPP